MGLDMVGYERLVVFECKELDIFQIDTRYIHCLVWFHAH